MSCLRRSEVLTPRIVFRSRDVNYGDMAPMKMKCDPFRFALLEGKTFIRNGRVSPGGCPPGLPTDPYWPNSGIRLVMAWVRYGTRYTEWTTRAAGSGKRSRKRLSASQLMVSPRLRRDNHFRQARVIASRNLCNAPPLPVIP
jgi:hypothetical protein